MTNTTFCFALTILAMAPMGEPNNAFLDMIVYLGAGLGGLYYAYKSNGGAEGKDFIARYLAISWVASIRWFVMVVIPFMLLFMMLKIATGSAESTTISETILFALITLIVYWKIGQHLKEIAGSKQQAVQ